MWIEESLKTETPVLGFFRRVYKKHQWAIPEPTTPLLLNCVVPPVCGESQKVVEKYLSTPWELTTLCFPADILSWALS